ncbi:MAG: hypothetical protein H6Q89_721 [Myxococcaceae bacterium]|nr:hypothetical protein [Myxococcaceae bacterium]
MLEEVDGRALVRSIPAEDVYATILDVGLADSAEVVQLSTPEQFRTYLDLAVWSRDRLDPLEVLRWLQAARDPDAEEDYAKKLSAIDAELIELVYKKLARVYDLEEDPDANPAGITLEMPEGRYLLEFLVEGVDEAALRRLTNDLIAANPFEFARFLEAVKWELPTELEETAYQFRQSRLQDLGFPPLEEAVKLFAWLDPAKLAPADSAQALAHPHARADYVEAAFKGLDAHERQVLEAEVRYLVNCALVAEGAEPGDPLAIRRISEQARDYLSLGLEHLCGGDPAKASDVVRAHTLKKTFQLGFSLTLQLKRQVERMASEPMAKFADTWLALDEEAAALAALLRKRPLRTLKVPGAEPVAFRARRELLDSEALLQRVRQQRIVLQALLEPSPAEVVARFGAKLSELTPQRLLAAAVAWAELDGVYEVKPLPAEKLPQLCELFFEKTATSARLKANVGARALALLPGPKDELKTMIDRALTSLLEDVGKQWAKDGQVDPKKILALPIEGEKPI